MSLGARVRHYRCKVGWTLEQLSEASGVEVGTISALENRNSQRSKFAPALAKAFGLNVEQLLDADRDWLDRPATYGTAAVSLAAMANEPRPRDPRWPFPGISHELVASLEPVAISRLEGALLLAAAQLGIEIRETEGRVRRGARIYCWPNRYGTPPEGES